MKMAQQQWGSQSSWSAAEGPWGPFLCVEARLGFPERRWGGGGGGRGGRWK